METGLSVTAASLSLPDSAALAALRAWHEGLSSRDAVTRYLGGARPVGQSSRGVIGAIRREIAAFARSRHRDDLAKLFTGHVRKGPAAARAMAAAIEQLRSAAVPVPLIGDGVDLWLGVIVFFLQIDTLPQKNSSRDKHLQNRLSETPCAFGAD